MPTSKISISGIPTIVNIGVMEGKKKLNNQQTNTKYYVHNIYKKQPPLQDFAKFSIEKFYNTPLQLPQSGIQLEI